MSVQPVGTARQRAFRALCVVAMSTLGATAAPAAPAKTANAAMAREYSRVFPTYPFSDPNPIPVVGRIYPYFRFDGFAKRAEQKIGRAHV